uniref:Uncharacterized protein n=1 Tax=Oryza meridionalis TaxID=40149 RepID=A0A0E0EPW8_9ORYZ
MHSSSSSWSCRSGCI